MEYKTPYFSVLITSFNRQNFISSSIECILSQSFNNYELIILDDFSSDKTFDIAHTYSLLDSRIKVYKNDVNIGQFANRNKIAKLAKGETLVYLDSDDTINSDALEYIFNCIQENNNISFGLICNDVESESIRVMKSDQALKYHFFTKSILHIGPSGTFIKKTLFDKIGGFPEIYGPVGDLYYNLTAAIHSNVLLLPYNYLNYRIHSGQEINNKEGYLSNSYKYFNDILSNSEIPLNAFDIKYLLKKNKRRFVVNCFKHIIATANFITIINAIRTVKFSFKDLLIAIFQK